jgi:hypothetical protein
MLFRLRSVTSFPSDNVGQRFTPILHRASLCCTCAVLVCCFATTADAQLLNPRSQLAEGAEPLPTESVPADAVPRSAAGRHIGSVTVDPLMTPAQEAAILEQLWQIDDTSWRGWTVARLTRELSNRMPVFLNGLELDLLGVDPDGPLFTQDPPAGRLAMRLACVLEPLELTLQIRRGVLEITSRDSAEADPLIRIYDVQVIVEPKTDRPKPSRSWQWNEPETLAGHIQEHIDPDSWVVAGGTNSITLVNTLNRRLLVVSAPTPTQWKVAKFLDVLNRSEINRGHAPWSRQTTTGHDRGATSPLDALPRSRDRLRRYAPE